MEEWHYYFEQSTRMVNSSQKINCRTLPTLLATNVGKNRKLEVILKQKLQRI